MHLFASMDKGVWPMPEYPVHEELLETACQYCVSLFLLKERLGVVPRAEDRNATVTLIEHGGRTYGVTCWHILERLRKRNARDATRFTLATVVGRMYLLGDRFVRPLQHSPVQRETDLVVMQVHPDLPDEIGKRPILLDKMDEPPWDRIKCAIAVGFPECAKESTHDALGQRVAIPCVHAVAECSPRPGERFHMFSELESMPDVRSLSGMSGGPVFWSTETRSGLLGITYEAASMTDGATNAPRIWIAVESLTPSIFKTWVQQHRQLGQDIKWLKEPKKG